MGFGACVRFHLTHAGVKWILGLDAGGITHLYKSCTNVKVKRGIKGICKLNRHTHTLLYFNSSLYQTGLMAI